MCQLFKLNIDLLLQLIRHGEVPLLLSDIW
jgi:hypothetical protein